MGAMGGGVSKKQHADVGSGAMASDLRGDSSDTAAPTNIGEKQQTNKETNDRIVNNNKDNNEPEFVDIQNLGETRE